MKILVIGNGGREHALVWKLAQSPRKPTLYCAPGNPGTARLGTNVPISPDDIGALLEFARKEKIDLTMVGPELPLTLGIGDQFRQAGLALVGPDRQAARLEGSKSFSKAFMEKHGIPTGEARSFTDAAAATDYIKEKNGPLVVKADGLAAGKGVVVAHDSGAALGAVDAMMTRKIHGEAGERVLVEECLVGQEVSFLVFSDGKNIVPMPSSQDHKAVFDGDKGPNTGGMGAYSPAPVVTETLRAQIMREVIEPAVAGLAEEGTPYRGILYAGLMLTERGPKVLEFNARFGDPETQPLLMRLETDLVDIFEAVARGTLGGLSVQWRPESAVCVVLAASGYPGKYEKGRAITGIEEAEKDDSLVVFQAGTAMKDGVLVTNGGRVLGVTALGPHLSAARNRVYKALETVGFEGAHYRKDIGEKGLVLQDGG